MKISKGKIILAIIVVYFSIMGIKNIRNEKEIDKRILKEVTIVKDGKIKKENEGKLVLVTGKIDYEGNISFVELENQIDSFKIERKVYDYIKEEKDNGKLSYKWKERLEENKSDDYLYNITSEVKKINPNIGEFKLDDLGLEKIDVDKTYKTQEKIGELEFDGLYYSLLSHEDNEKVGDMRLSYRYFDMSKTKYLSIFAKQNKDSFVPYKYDSKTEVYNIYKGKVDTKEKLEKKLDNTVKVNSKGKIIFILMIIGVGIFFIVDSKKINKG